MRRKLYVGLACAVLAVLPATSRAEVYYGCYVCASVDVGMTGTGRECRQVGDGQEGDGTKCRQENIFGPACATSGNPCYNVVVDGGGGGGTSGGGGGGTCAYDDNGYCAPWCSACSRV